MSRHAERGSISLWLVTSSLVMTILVGLAVDLGGQVHAKQRVHALAAQAARAGGQEVHHGPAAEGRYLAVSSAAGRTSAHRYLAAAGVTGTVTIDNGDTITVVARDTYRPRFLSLIGIGDLPVTGTASARLIRTIGGNEQ